MSKRFVNTKGFKNQEVEGACNKGNCLCFDNGVPPWKKIMLIFLMTMFLLISHSLHSNPNDSEFVTKYIFYAGIISMLIGSILMCEEKKENTLIQAIKVIVSNWLK